MDFENRSSISVALLGRPNAGKSTLINLLVGQQISIVTHKVQTTRDVIRGVVTIDNTQIVFLDTPGIFEPSKQLEKAIVHNALSSIEEADIVCFIIDAREVFTQEYLPTLKKLNVKSHKLFAIINKIDLIEHDQVLPALKHLSDLGIFEEIFPISALKAHGTNHFVNFVKSRAKPGPWMFEEDDVTDKSMRFIAEEITRKHAYILLHQEIPYSLKIVTEKWDEDEKNIKIYQAIYLTKPSHKSIALGKGGEKIKEIGRRARIDLQKSLDKKVHLFLYIKIREDWIERDFAKFS